MAESLPRTAGVPAKSRQRFRGVAITQPGADPTAAQQSVGLRDTPWRAWPARAGLRADASGYSTGLRGRGRPEDVAEEIAARTVNKERARTGEAREASTTSVADISSGRRGGLRSHSGAAGRTRDQLYAEAKRKKIRGRSTMTKAQLLRAVGD